MVESVAGRMSSLVKYSSLPSSVSSISTQSHRDFLHRKAVTSTQVSLVRLSLKTHISSLHLLVQMSGFSRAAWPCPLVTPSLQKLTIMASPS